VSRGVNVCAICRMAKKLELPGMLPWAGTAVSRVSSATAGAARESTSVAADTAAIEARPTLLLNEVFT